MKKIKFDRIKTNKKSSINSDKKKALSKILKNVDDCILCQKSIKLKSMPILIQKALSKKHNDIKSNEYIDIIDDILEERNTINYINHLEIEAYSNNQNIFRKIFVIEKFPKKMKYLWNIYQYVIFIPRFFQIIFFKSFNKYFESIRKVRDKFLSELIKKIDEEEILKLKIDIKDIFKLKPKDIIIENNPKSIKNKFLNITVTDYFKYLKPQKNKEEFKFSIKNIISNFSNKNLKNKVKDQNIKSDFLIDLKNNFASSLSEILNNSFILKNKFNNKEYSKMSFLNSVIQNEKDPEILDPKIIRNFKKKPNTKNKKINYKSKNISKNKSKNYNIKNLKIDNDVKKIKIINNININSGNNYKKYIKNFNFPLPNLKINNDFDNIIKKTSRNNNIIKQNSNFCKTDRGVIKRKNESSPNKIIKNIKKNDNYKSVNNLNNKNEKIKSKTKKYIEKSRSYYNQNPFKTKIINKQNNYYNIKNKQTKSITSKQVLTEYQSTKNNVKNNKEFIKNKFQTLKYSGGSNNKLVTTPIKIKINKEKFDGLKNKFFKKNV